MPVLLIRHIALLLTLLPARVLAHELETSVKLAAPAVILRVTYAGTDPVPFAKVQVFAPGTDSVEFQAGRTDRRGHFSFVPEPPGAWRVVVDDEEGHRREVAVTVPDSFRAGAAVPAPGSAGSRWERALAGLALIAGGTGALYWYLKARGPRPAS